MKAKKEKEMKMIEEAENLRLAIEQKMIEAMKVEESKKGSKMKRARKVSHDSQD